MIPQITESLANSWKLGLSGISAENLKRGLEAAREHKGYFDIGTFRGYCRKPIGAAPSYSETVPRLSELTSLGKTEKAKDLLKVTLAMLAEDGDGPITQATKAKLLDRDFVKTRSSAEIIDYCQKRFPQK